MDGGRQEFAQLVATQATIANRYRVDKLIGAGGMGAVLGATHVDLGEKVAIKLLYTHVGSMPGMRDRFLNEARSAARLRGQHVARVTDVGTLDDGTLYLVMEHLEGVNLDSAAESGIEVDLAVSYVLHACEALAEAHAAGIVHRDIKPANLFVTTEPDGAALLKVLDFGVSRAPQDTTGRLTDPDLILGTPAYMSPEQMRGASQADTRSDIWSLGAVLYELIEGQLPFGGGAFSDLCIHVSIRPPLPFQRPSPPGLQRTILRCLEKQPAARWQTVGTLARALVPYARDVAQNLVRVARIERIVKLMPAPASIEAAAPAGVTVVREARQRVSMVALARPGAVPR